jgi:hypothetical protein
MPAVVVAGGLAAAGAVGGAAIGASATKKAAKSAAAIQQQTARESNALARENRDFLYSKIQPTTERGDAAGATINALLGLGGDTTGANNAFRQFIGNSDFAFQEGQGERGLAARLSAAGGVESGAAIKATQRFRTDLQSGYRGQFFDLLGRQQGAGLSGLNALAGVGTNFVNTVTNNNQNAADAASNAALIRGNANAGFASTAGNALGQFAGMAFGGGFGGSFGKLPTQTGGFGGPMRPTQYGGWI